MSAVFIIAEAGVNHNGSIELAKKMIDVASDAGADAVKFQTFTAEKLLTEGAEKADYQKTSTGNEESQFDMIRRLELDMEAHRILQAHCEKRNILFMSTPFDLESVMLLNALGLNIFKIPSGEITNMPYLRAIGALKKRVLLSTGMSSLGEVEDALEVLIMSGTDRSAITVLHANTMYPTPMEDVNLNAMKTIQAAFATSVGYSDHTLGIEVDIAAVAMGASVIEKHFTLDRSMEGPDHGASLEPNELQAMVRAIRNIERALGDGIKRPSPSEKPNIPVARKSIIAKCVIKKGERFTSENLDVKRPGTGLSPMRWDELIGTEAQRDYRVGELL